MASGFGLTGNKGRCYDFWLDFSECISKAIDPKQCVELRDDYIECLHHRKEYTRLNLMYREYEKKTEEEKKALNEKFLRTP